MNSEVSTKLDRLRGLMQQRNVDALHLTQIANAAWLSGGKRTYIDTATERGVASLLVLPDRQLVLTNTIEGERLRGEEGLGDWEIVAEPWHAPSQALDQMTQGMRVGVDQSGPDLIDLSADLVAIRAPLLPEEIERYRALGRDAGAALGTAARALRPDMTEFEAAGVVAQQTFNIGAVPTVVLVASDERFRTIRHPLPTAKPIERVVMLVLCARRDGLLVSLTRIVHFGPAPHDLQQRIAAVAHIDVTTIAATRPGARIADVFARLQAAYSEVGFADEWRNHHQGGACSYSSRDYIATPASTEIVNAPQAFAWNPSVPGAKSEDTVLITDAGADVLTSSPDWPMISVTSGALTLDRPNVLEL